MRDRKYSDEQFEEAVKDHSPASTSEVAETVGCTRQLADTRLKELAESTELEHKQIAKVSVWYYECK
jgi:predicted transcriptional regulator